MAWNQKEHLRLLAKKNERPLGARWNEKVLPIPGGCWRWTGAINASGYGVMGFGGRAGGNILAHRAALLLTGIEIPIKRDVMHSCDNKWCVNPSHLDVGTRSQNMKDAYARGLR